MSFARACLLLIALAAGVGCTRTQGPPPAPPPPQVYYQTPVLAEIQDYEDFPGRLEPVDSVEIRSRVTGYIAKANFKEGADVKKGDILFEIDASFYEAELAKAEANLVLAEAHRKRLDEDYQRAVKMLGTGVTLPLSTG